MTLLERIERHLKDNHISATRFGRRAVGDPRFVLDLRMGRRPRRRTIERLNAYLNTPESSCPPISPQHCAKDPNGLTNRP